MNSEIAKYLDSTNLNKIANNKDIKKLVNDAIKYNVAGVCVTPSWAYFVKNKLKGTGIKTVYVPNWRIGGGLKPNEIMIIKDVKDDIDELDYVINIYEMYELKRWENVEEELKYVRDHCKVFKVIIEAAYVHYNHFEDLKKYLKWSIEISEKCGADYIKTDSGIFKRKLFKESKDGNTTIIKSGYDTLMEDVKLIKKMTKLPVKVAGGVGHYDVALELTKLGVERIGTSSANIICEEEYTNKEHEQYKKEDKC